MLLTLPHHQKSKILSPIKVSTTPDFFIRLLELWECNSVAPILQDNLKISLKVANPIAPNSWVWGGVGLFFPQSKGLSKARSVLASIFGEILCDENYIFIPIVHTETEHISIITFLDEFFSDISITYKMVDTIDIPTHMDLTQFRWIGFPHPSWRLSFTWACERLIWPLSSRKIDDFKKTADILGLKSKYDINTPNDFYKILRDIPSPKQQLLGLTYPTLSEFFELIILDAPITSIKWDNFAGLLRDWLNNLFPWIEADLIYPPKMEKSIRIFIDIEKILKLYLLQLPDSIIRTHQVAQFFKENGVSLTMDQLTGCLKNFLYTESSGDVLSLHYKIKDKSRVWVISRKNKDGISIDLNFNPFYV